MNPAHATAFYDIQGLSSLRSQAVQQPSGAVGEVASQFEALFVQMMLKSMRDASIKGGLFESNQMDLYQSMFDQQVSLHLARQNSMGLADTLVQQLDGTNAEPTRVADARSLAGLEALADRSPRTAPLPPAPPAGAAPAAGVAQAAGVSATPGPVAAQNSQPDWSPDSPREFIRDVWEHAVGAAGKIGLDPLVLVAQSALETGWGKKVIQAADGRSSFNLFGIKAGHDWTGEAAVVNTVEFRDGVAALERASFRMYDSLAGSFEDYVDFLTGNPRYQQALEHVTQGREFLRELQHAGYATDPLYAQKIIDIVDTDSFRAAVDQLKNLRPLTLTGWDG